MSDLDMSRLSPGDAIVALRSFPDRFRAAILPITDDPAVEDLTYVTGPDGRSAIDEVVATTNTWVLLHRALEQVAIQDDPVLHPAAADVDQRHWEVEAGTRVSDALDRLADAAAALVDQAERTHGPEWERSGRVAGGSTVTALDLLHDAVGTATTRLRMAESALAAARRS